jgi:hypothetical protein
MLIAIVNGGFLSGFAAGSRHSSVVNISHMLFADDTLIFCGANPDHLRYLHALFLCFEVSGLKSSSALVVREVGEEGVFPFPLGGYSFVTPVADKGDDFRLTGLIQY